MGSYGASSGAQPNTEYSGTGGPGTPSKAFNEPRSIIPIVVSMINKCLTQQEGSFLLFDSKVTNVSLCGLVMNCTDSTAGSKEYTIHDSTGVIKGKYYVTSQEANDTITGYAKIIGSLKEYNNRVSLTIHSILPVLRMDEVTAHYLSTISCYLYYKKKTNTSSTAVTGEATAASNGAEYGSSLSDTESKIYSVLQANRANGGEGMLVEDIEKTLAAQGVSREEVRFHVDQMVQNMAIYESNPGMYTIQS